MEPRLAAHLSGTEPTQIVHWADSAAPRATTCCVRSSLPLLSTSPAIPLTFLLAVASSSIHPCMTTPHAQRQTHSRTSSDTHGRTSEPARCAHSTAVTQADVRLETPKEREGGVEKETDRAFGKALLRLLDLR